MEHVRLERSEPLVACVTELANRFGYAAPGSLFEMLPRDLAGVLPFHQAGAALETAGLNYEPVKLGRLPVREAMYPAIVELAGEGPVVLHERKGEDLLVWRPSTGESRWEPIAAIRPQLGNEFLAVAGDPDRLRNEASPWHAKGRQHWFWSELRKEKAALRPVLTASLIINLLALALPLFTMNVYDRVIPNKATASLWVLAIGVFIAFALDFALKAARANVLDEVGRRLDLRLSQKIFVRLLSLPLSARRGSTGGLAARVSEYAIVRDFFASTTVVLLVDGAFLILFLGVIAYIAGWLALVPLVAIAGMLVAGFFLQRRVVDAARDMQSDHGLQQTLLVETIAGGETLKSVSGESGMVGRWHALAEIGSRSQQRLRRITAIAGGLAATFQQVSSVALVIGGYYLFASGKITMGAIIAIVMLASRSLAPAAQAALLLTRGRQAKETLSSIEEVFGREDERQRGTAAPAVPLGATIRLENLTFAYPEAETNAIDGIDLTIEPGEKVAIIGRVASGKSTLGRLICGLYEPTDGALLIGGIDSRQFRPHEVRRAFRFVGQDANLFTGTIRDNLAIAAPGVSEDQLRRALHASGADEFLARDAGGFSRAVGEQGRRLSGGQRAFLSLSRALVMNSQLLYLDEPTGAMDSQTERLLVERLQSALTENQTLVVSTHRPALFALCNRIVVLDKGRVVADGPKEQILGAAAATAGMQR